MLKIISIIGGVIVIAIVGVLAYAATRPDTFRVQRSATIKAPPEKIFALLNDFHRYGEWSPYEKLDADMKRVHSGAPSGKGAAYAWESSGKAGIGRMEITESSPTSKIQINLDFVKPFTAHNKVEYTLQTKGDATEVTWAMYGDSPYISKLMGVFFNFDKLVGDDFETGLATIKTIAEK
ncbi:SRPBCC family protein [Reyranella sp. CPCC 100927]|uniref:SRPBCC family protein n=1 Tax=Reyranella sp. CPCC 100927 TaxID=2599616 RepID=UPI0011B6008F|nr:SRPBCC family protein [Reyranella sp. CPCC 100927]TWT11479.1 SRPBCC family protein [Reyranella sp. CPCC 100927]